MNKLIAAVLAFTMALAFASSAAFAEDSIPDFCKPILEAWGATNEKELQQAVLEYWEESQPKEWKGMHKGAKTPVSFQFGGTTKELIANHKKWDVAIVSSQEADLQKLADAGVIICNKGWMTPVEFLALEQWTYPQAVQQMLPNDPLRYYYLYCYSYDAQTGEAVFVICNEKGRPSRWANAWARQIVEHRSADQTRALEGFCRKIDWEYFAMPELSATEDELVANSSDWDWAFLRIEKDDRLEKLDQNGLLYDFSQETYWKSRNPQQEELDIFAQLSLQEKPRWNAPSGVWSKDGRLIAIPYNEWNYNGENEISVFVVNAKSSFLARALEYAKHYIKSYEWYAYGSYTYYSNPEEMKQYQDYYKNYKPGCGVILKKDVSW